MNQNNAPDNGQETVTHYKDVIMSTMASQITSRAIVYSTACSGSDQRKHQSSASLAFVRGIHRWTVNSPRKGPVTRKMFPFDDVIMRSLIWMTRTRSDIAVFLDVASTSSMILLTITYKNQIIWNIHVTYMIQNHHSLMKVKISHTHTIHCAHFAVNFLKRIHNIYPQVAH